VLTSSSASDSVGLGLGASLLLQGPRGRLGGVLLLLRRLLDLRGEVFLRDLVAEQLRVGDLAGVRRRAGVHRQTAVGHRPGVRAGVDRDLRRRLTRWLRNRGRCQTERPEYDKAPHLPRAYREA
jgi:hypothetical protein